MTELNPRRDAATLEAALSLEPANPRYAFYLAQSWREAGDLAKAVDAYERRASMGGWEEEVYCSLLEIGRLSVRLGKSQGTVIEAFLRAYEFRATRAEALCDLATYLREHGRNTAAYPFARTASETPRPADVLFVDESVYAWRALDEHAISAYWAGKPAEGLALNERLLALDSLPPRERARIEGNLAYCRERLGGSRA
jgi:hypothetical protein